MKGYFVKNGKTVSFEITESNHSGYIHLLCEKADVDKPIPNANLAFELLSLPSKVIEQSSQNNRIQFRVSPEEKQWILEMADDNFQTLSEYLRERILGTDELRREAIRYDNELHQ